MAEQIEVYESKHSAQQVEDAMGAVLSIGPNGNWFIGENDTGVYAGGVKITGTAEIGQALVVYAIDQAGKPTIWKTSDIKNHYRLIKRITLDEEATAIDFSEDEDGNPFVLTDIILLGCTQGTATTGQMRINCVDFSTDDRYSVIGPLDSFRGLDTTKRYWTINMRYIGIGSVGNNTAGLWDSSLNYVDSSYSGYGNTTRYAYPKAVYCNTAFGPLTEVTFLRVFSNTTGNNFKAGSYVELWGR
jgi:hypothetical protein